MMQEYKRVLVPVDGSGEAELSFKKAIEAEDNIEKSKNSNLPLKYMSPAELTQYINEQEQYIKEIVPKLGI